MCIPACVTILQGLYPESHGIVDNYFRDKILKDSFSLGNNDPKWWLGEPVSTCIHTHVHVCKCTFANCNCMCVDMGNCSKTGTEVWNLLLARIRSAHSR